MSVEWAHPGGETPPELAGEDACGTEAVSGCATAERSRCQIELAGEFVNGRLNARPSAKRLGDFWSGAKLFDETRGDDGGVFQIEGGVDLVLGAEVGGEAADGGRGA